MKRSSSLLGLAWSAFVVIGALSGALACSKKSDTTAADASVAPSASALAPEPRQSSSGAANANGNARPASEAELEAVAKRWNDALRTRNAEALRDVYGSHVRLYGVRMTRDAAIKQKAAALAKAPDYTQTMAQPSLDDHDAMRPMLVFQKAWTIAGKPSSVLASLTFANEGGAWVVSEESDAMTDAKLDPKRDERTLAKGKAGAEGGGCEGAVVSAVMSLDEARRLLQGPTNPSGGHSSNGLRVMGGPPDSKTFSVAIHENHEDHLATLAWFDVDPATGSVTGANSDEVVKVDPAVKKACASVVTH